MLDLPPPDPGIEINIASQGMSKGLRQTDGPQVVVRPEVAFGPVYVGVYAKNVSSPTSDGETGATIGLRTGAGGFDLSASASWKIAVAPTAGLDDQALELNAAVSRRIGPLTPRVSVTWSPDELGSTGRSTFAEAGASYRLAEGATVSAAAARRERDGGPDYTAFNAGASYTLAEHFTLDLRWYDTDRSGLGEIYRGRLVGSVRARF
ncbi:MAG TPA: porin [Allosphingosinicella sp.]|jgi:predicted porin